MPDWWAGSTIGRLSSPLCVCAPLREIIRD
jgi:hypothetical protein